MSPQKVGRMGTRLKPTEQKALAWYAKQNNLKIQLSMYPEMFFKDEDGEEIKKYMFHIMRLYKERNEGKK